MEQENLNLSQTNSQIESVSENPTSESATMAEASAVETTEDVVASPSPTENQVEVAPAIAETKTEASSSEEQLSNAELRRRSKRARIIQAFNEVKQAFNEGKPIEVYVYSRVRGGLRVFYKEAPLFLPASHFHIKKSPTDDELLEVVGKKLMVKIQEIQEYDEGSMAVIVSRKKFLEDEFWANLKVGQVVEGKVTSIATFGVFIDLGGAEGLIHISRLAPFRITNIREHINIGDTLKAVIVEIDKENQRIGLSRKELLGDIWPISPEKYAVGTKHTGIVRRIFDFGAFVELEPGAEGLLRTSEISWIKRIRRPNEVIKVGDKIEVVVTNFDAEKKAISLSMKRITENPWPTIHEKYPKHSIYEGIVKQVVAQGCVVSINNEIDGFMPRSKMRSALRGNKIPFKSGDKIKVEIADIVPEDESLILEYVEDETEKQTPKKNFPQKQFESKPVSSGISIMDMLSEDEKKNLMKSLNK